MKELVPFQVSLFRSRSKSRPFPMTFVSGTVIKCHFWIYSVYILIRAMELLIQHHIVFPSYHVEPYDMVCILCVMFLSHFIDVKKRICFTLG